MAIFNFYYVQYGNFMLYKSSDHSIFLLQKFYIIFLFSNCRNFIEEFTFAINVEKAIREINVNS